MLDVIVLTEARYVSRDSAPATVPDWYLEQVLREDARVVDALRARGLSVERRAWDDPAVLSGRVRSLLFRTTWDYFERWPEFSAWLEVAAERAELLNPEALIHWNLDKHYLEDLDGQGVTVVPTRWASRGVHDLEALASGWDEVVVKPAISGAGRDTFRVRLPDREGESRFRRLVEAEDVLVQPFLPAILSEGEVSVVVIGGAVTHAVRKVAAAGEFRVQDDHGGTVQAHVPTPAEAALAKAAVAACDPCPLYARVDMVSMDGEPAIMELELVEPELFFRFGEHAGDALAKAVEATLEASTAWLVEQVHSLRAGEADADAFAHAFAMRRWWLGWSEGEPVFEYDSEGNEFLAVFSNPLFADAARCDAFRRWTGRQIAEWLFADGQESHLVLDFAQAHATHLFADQVQALFARLA
ncbi:MAG: hypothetical protein EP330_18985 [Deltaproteobacteria bacterium]|nr:MAG: hypothetical protein EP330_18985 [Deltaproteobacteria bacterium]